MILACPLCGAALGEIDAGRWEPIEHACPACGGRLVLRRIEGQPATGDAGTVVQARFLIETLDGEAADTVAAAAGGEAVGEIDAPPLPPGVEAFFMVLGAPAGRERIRLERARTVFGGAGADVDLDDARLAARHFQVDAMGREFFLRDLGSGRGTRLNGREVRYVELLPGDEVTAGGTVLVFRSPDDGVGRRHG